MKKFEGFLLLTDMDGTFYDNRGVVSDETKEAIEYYKENGGLFTISTGRPHHDLKAFLGYVNTNYIGLNGTVIRSPENGEILYTDKMDKAGSELFCRVFKENKGLESAHIYFENDSIVTTRAEFDADSDILMRKSEGRKWCKGIWVGPEEIVVPLEENLIKTYGDRYNFDRSWHVGLEMHSKTSGKGEFIDKLIELSGKEIHTTVAAGDFENDFSMIRRADIGYAVGNALDSVKKIADRITVTNNESAIAKIIFELDKEI